MAIELYPHNEEAYQKVIRMVQKHRSTVGIYPTGMGKSVIAFKLTEEYSGQRIVWLAPSEYIFHSQKENYQEAGGQDTAVGHHLSDLCEADAQYVPGRNDE